MNSCQARAYLNSFINHETLTHPKSAFYFHLDRVHGFLHLLGDPQDKIKFVHIAGTKGKGSTSAFVTYILQSAGYRVGLYTSPHLHDDKERNRILQQGVCSQDPFWGKISEKNFCSLLQTIQQTLEPVRSQKKYQGLTYFEIFTVLAILHFFRQHVDFAVLETGLGGRLDATNVVDSLVCAITPVGLEHQKQLGMTLAKIANEKAAIIKKRNQPVVVAPQEKEALEVINKRIKKFHAAPLMVDRDIKIRLVTKNLNAQIFNIQSSLRNYAGIKTRLLGEFQGINMCVAIGIIESLEKLGYNINLKAIHRGIKNTVWPGRFEIIQKNPYVVLDSAHTVESSRLLADSIREIFPNRTIALVLGLSRDKNIQGICRELNRVATTVTLTKSTHARAYDFKTADIKKLFTFKEVIYKKDVTQAMKCVLSQAAFKDVVLVCGSIFVVGEARKLCIKLI